MSSAAVPATTATVPAASAPAAGASAAVSASGAGATAAADLPVTASAVPWVDRTLRMPGHAPLTARVFGHRDAASPAPVVLHFHSGAFTSGSLDSAEPIARLLANAGAVVVSLDYPLAPAHPFPQAVEAGYAALCWLQKHRAKFAGADAPIVLAGEEAGGNIAAAVASMARDRQRPKVAAQILFGPMLDACVGTASLRKAAVGRVDCKWAHGWHDYLGATPDPSHPYAVPGRAMRLAGLPATLLFTAEDDPMRDEALGYAARLRAADVLALEFVLPGTTGWPFTHGATIDAALPWPRIALDRCRQFLSSVEASHLAAELRPASPSSPSTKTNKESP